MSALAVVTSSPPSTEGGHLVIARSLVAAARESGYDAHLVITPDCQFGRQALNLPKSCLVSVRHQADKPLRRRSHLCVTSLMSILAGSALPRRQACQALESHHLRPGHS